jgi:hypothetical protein
VGGAHRSGDVEIVDDVAQDLAALHFTLSRSARCAAFASAWAANPGGLTVDNAYYFGLHWEGEGSHSALRLEFDDNAGYDDAGALPVAMTRSWLAERGEHAIAFQARKEDDGDADVTVSSASLAVVCGKATPEP